MPDLPYGMSPEEYEVSMATIEKYQGTARLIVEKLVQAYELDSPEGGAYVVRQLFAAQDETLTMMVLGCFTAVLVETQRKVGAPVATLAEQGKKGEHAPWHTAVMDQLEGAAEQKDYPGYARIMADGMIHALTEDKRAYDVDFDHVMKSMLTLDQHSLVMMATEAMLRLVKGSG